MEDKRKKDKWKMFKRKERNNEWKWKQKKYQKQNGRNKKAEIIGKEELKKVHDEKKGNVKYETDGVQEIMKT